MSAPVNAPVYTDFQGIGELRAKSRADASGALKDVAKQFEGIFLNMMLKSMRDASAGDPLFDSQEGDMYRDMFDQQLTLNISNGRGIGLADSLVRQLSPHIPHSGQEPVAGDEAQQLLLRSKLLNSPLPMPVQQADKNSGFSSQKQFVDAIAPHAAQAARELGVDPKVLIAQAALETGWGKSVIRQGDGVSSHNLFNIKADGRWSGNRVGVATLEYKDGVPYRTQASFRAYDSYAESFSDYVRLVKNSPRYADALQVANDPQAYLQALQKAGYATDPAYASKITHILSSDLMG